MQTTDARGGVELTLSARGAGYAAIQQCLALQSEILPLTRVEKFFGITPLASNAHSWYLGALGEIVVAEKLEQLGDEWRVVNGVPAGAGGSDIDHVVVGPSGVFTINTRAHATRKVWAAGLALRIKAFSSDYVRSAQDEAARASKLLTSAVGRPVVVTPFIVMVGISEMNYGLRRPDVDTVTSRGILRNLRRRKRVLTADEVVEIAEVASRRGTWHREAVFLDDTQSLVERFERLRTEVDAASYRRTIWIVLDKLALMAAGFWVAVQLVQMVADVLAGHI
jgi:Nuclease-related domain